MDHPEKLRDLYTKIGEAQGQVVMLMNEEINRGPAKDTKLRGFIIDNRPFPNPTEQWVDGFTAICDILSIIYGDEFNKVLDFPDFTENPDVDFGASSIPYEIRNTGVFVNTRNGSERKKGIIESLGELFECQIHLDYY